MSNVSISVNEGLFLPIYFLIFQETFNLTSGNSNWPNEWNVNKNYWKKYLNFAVFDRITVNELFFFTKLPYSTNKLNLRKVARNFLSYNRTETAEITVNKPKSTYFQIFLVVTEHVIV